MFYISHEVNRKQEKIPSSKILLELKCSLLQIAEIYLNYENK